jgi:hypothetical protein
MQKKITVLLILLTCTMAVLAGCTGTTSTPEAPQTPAQGPGTPAATAAAPAASAQDNLVPSPTDVIPENNLVTVTVQEKIYNGKIPVVFDGGKGLYLVKSIKVTLYRADGQVMTYDLGIKKGDTVELDGMRQTDRVVVHVTEMNGETYKVTDVLSVYREH